MSQTLVDDAVALPLQEKIALANTLVESLLNDVHQPQSFQRFLQLPPSTAVQQSPDWGSLWATGTYASHGGQEPTELRTATVDPLEDAPFLPTVLCETEQLSRRCDAVNTALASHLKRAHATRASRLERLGIPQKDSLSTSTSGYLAELTGISTSTARARLRAAEHFMPQPFPGALLELEDAAEPMYRATAATLTEAVVAPEVTRVIAQTLDDVARYGRGCKTDEEQTKRALRIGDDFLSAQARERTADEMRTLCKDWGARTKVLLDQDGTPPDDPSTGTRPRLSYNGTTADGLHSWTAELDQIAHELLLTSLSAAANPRSDAVLERAAQLQKLYDDYADETGLKREGPLFETNAESGSEPHSGQDTAQDTEQNTGERPTLEVKPGEVPLDPMDESVTPDDPWEKPEGFRLDRGLREALHADALLGMLVAGAQVMAGTPRMPRTNGVLPRITAVVDIEQLRREAERQHRRDTDSEGPPPDDDAGRAALRTALIEATHSGTMSPSDLLTLSCDAHILPAVMNPTKSAVLQLGRDHRLISTALRAALVARDGGCARPGCTAPASWSQGHHIRHWAEGGPTDLDNLVLLCPGCHRLVHQGKYTIKMVDAVPWFTPALWLCPDPTPQRNRCHRPWDDDLTHPPDPTPETPHEPPHDSADAPPTGVT